MKKTISIYILLCFLVTSIMGPNPVFAQDFVLPAPGQMVVLSPTFSPAVLKGIKLDPKNPFRFHFFVDSGDSKLSQNELKNESSKLIKYFLASLAIPEKDLWVNLSPYEKNRIVPQEFGQTEMGRDLLAEDYILKQITASLIYPDSNLGKYFWQKVYAKAQAKYGTTNIPINTFNKVWIVPEKAVVYENGGVAFVLENHLKVMLEQDYLSLGKHEGIQSKQAQVKDTNQIGSQIVREIVIPALTKEVNNGKNFSQLRQVFYSLILATWYKKKIKDSILNRIYSDQKKVGGINVPAKDQDRIYQEYLKAFKKGVYNYIKEEPGRFGNEAIPRKYFSGGVLAAESPVYKKNVSTRDFAQVGSIIDLGVNVQIDQAMTTKSKSSLIRKKRILTQEVRKILDRIGQLVESQDSRAPVELTLEGVAGLGKTTLAEIIQRTGVGKIKPQRIAVMHTDFYLPEQKIEDSHGSRMVLINSNGRFVLKEGSNIFIYMDWDRFMDDYNKIVASKKRLVVMDGLYAMKFCEHINKSLGTSLRSIRRIAIQAPRGISRNRALKRDGTGDRHEASLLGFSKIQKEFNSFPFSLTISSNVPFYEDQRAPIKTGKDFAMGTKGGIDLNPAQMTMQLKKDGQDFKFDFNDIKIDAAQVTGATFTIFTMTPVTNLSKTLELNTADNKIFSTSPML